MHWSKCDEPTQTLYALYHTLECRVCVFLCARACVVLVACARARVCVCVCERERESGDLHLREDCNDG